MASNNSKRAVAGVKTQKAITGTPISNCDTTGQLVLLNATIPGTSIDRRLAQRIYLTSGMLFAEAKVTANTGLDQFQRVMIVIDHQPNGATPAIMDVLVSATTYSQVNLNNRHRFTVVADKHYHLNAAAEPDSQKNFSMKLPALLTSYNAGSAGTIADIATNAVYVLTLGSEPAGNTAGSCRISYRYFFKDQ